MAIKENKEALNTIIKNDYGYNFSQDFRDSVEIIRKAIDDLDKFETLMKKYMFDDIDYFIICVDALIGEGYENGK